MASTYVNNLRLNEMATGDQSGTWGTTTNTNLELIGQAFGWGTRAIANASIISPTGVSGTSALGTIAIQGSCVISSTGVSATGFIGEENVWGKIVPSSTTPDWTEIAA